MTDSDDPTLGELERDGQIGNALALLYGRLLGGRWRECRISAAREAVAYERYRHEHGIDLRKSRHVGSGRAA
jgi:hypothetical protein